MTEKETDAIDQAQNDLFKVRRVARALGIRLKQIPLLELASIAEKVDDIVGSLKRLKKTTDPRLRNAILSPDYAIEVSLCIQELPSATLVRDLKLWQQHPRRIPEWTSLRLRSSRARNNQMGNILGHIIRSTMAELSLGDLVSNFDISTVKRLGNQRRLFFIAAFQTVYETDNQKLTPKEFDDQLEAELLRQQSRKQPRKERVYLKPAHDEKRNRPQDPSLKVELDLWQYATENSLLDKMVKSGMLTSEEIARLTSYFDGSGRKSLVDEILMNKFSIAVARLA